MTKEEILKAADEAVDEIMNVEFWDTGIRRVQKSEATKIAILHYEKIVERDKDIDAISLYCDKSPYCRKKTHEAELILAELKIRL